MQIKTIREKNHVVIYVLEVTRPVPGPAQFRDTPL
jgi:hypothetical protein